MTRNMPDLADLNLDSMDADDLEHLSESLHTLHQFAKLKAFAMRERAAGRVVGANMAEAQLDVLFLDLPQNWRW